MCGPPERPDHGRCGCDRSHRRDRRRRTKRHGRQRRERRKDGVGIREVSLNDSGELIVALTDGTETNLGKITGEDGAPGVGISSVQVGENGMLTVTLTNGESVEAGAVFSAQEGKTVRTVSISPPQQRRWHSSGSQC